jgi:hypothetical protein
MTQEYVYMLIEREFIKTKEPIYKIGRTGNFHQRMKSYPKNSEIIMSFVVTNCIKVETLLMRSFKQKFKQRIDIGQEYFEGELKELKKVFQEIVLPEINAQTESAFPSLQPCECGFICSSKFNFERHRSSRRHEINMLCSESLVMNEDGYYECNLCNYCSSNEINYRRHVSSDKHKVAKERRMPMQTSVVPQQTIAMPMSNDVSGIVKPVMLVEVMEMCFNFMKQDREFMKQDRDSQNTQQTEMFKMFADRITAHQAQQVQLLQQLTNNANENTTTTTTGDNTTTTTGDNTTTTTGDHNTTSTVATPNARPCMYAKTMHGKRIPTRKNVSD